jgi:hypothetical protein
LQRGGVVVAVRGARERAADLAVVEQVGHAHTCDAVCNDCMNVDFVGHLRRRAEERRVSALAITTLRALGAKAAAAGIAARRHQAVAATEIHRLGTRRVRPTRRAHRACRAAPGPPAARAAPFAPFEAMAFQAAQVFLRRGRTQCFQREESLQVPRNRAPCIAEIAKHCGETPCGQLSPSCPRRRRSAATRRP